MRTSGRACFDRDFSGLNPRTAGRAEPAPAVGAHHRPGARSLPVP
jgi:hypothetical protein